MPILYASAQDVLGKHQVTFKLAVATLSDLAKQGKHAAPEMVGMIQVTASDTVLQVQYKVEQLAGIPTTIQRLSVKARHDPKDKTLFLIFRELTFEQQFPDAEISEVALGTRNVSAFKYANGTLLCQYMPTAQFPKKNRFPPERAAPMRMCDHCDKPNCKAHQVKMEFAAKNPPSMPKKPTQVDWADDDDWSDKQQPGNRSSAPVFLG